MRKKLWLLMVIIFVAAIADKLLSPKTIVDESLLVDSSALVTVPPDKLNINISTEPIFNEYQKDRFVAHRGFSDHAPENSMPAFELAGKGGFWGIETDVIETIDGVFMCMHDDELDRTTTGTGLTWEHTYSELMEYNIDFGNDIQDYQDLKIPTLIEFLNTCVIYDCVPLIEIKHITDHENLLKTIEESGLKDRCIVSGGIEDLKKFREFNTTIPVMVVGYSNKPYTFYTELISQIPVNAGILYDRNVVDRAVVDELHSKGLLIGVWTLDTGEEAEKYKGFGVDFVVTNHIPGLEHMVNTSE